MIFHYLASGQDEKIVENDVEAKDVAEVLALLSASGLKPVSVRETESKSITFKLFGRRVTLTDQIFISKYLALMLRIGTGLLEAINILIADFHKPAVKDILITFRTALEQGRPFYSTFARYPKVFSPVYINLVRAGETSGNLENTFVELTHILTKQKELKDEIRGALTYPIILFIGSILILLFIVMFALPKIAKVFSEGGIEPPAFSRVVFGIGTFFDSYGIIFFVALAMLVVGFVIAWRQLLLVRKFISSLLGEIPVVKDIVKKIALQRFASILASLIKAGMPITEAIEITADTVSSLELQQALRHIAREGIAKGLTIGDAFRREPFFPLVVVSLVAISEKAGHLGEVLETLAEFYVKEIDSSIKTLVSFLEPALLLGIGTIIGFIALAIIVPIYQLTSQF
ncbi:MAG: type II secretion system F family protein [Patescibacteria group bacterium]